MAKYVFNNQATQANLIRPTLVMLRALMNGRKHMWYKMTPEERQNWIDSAPSMDPIMELAWDIYKDLHNDFFSKEKYDVV